jgi:hypothetical protein
MKYLIIIGLLVLTTQAFGQKKTVVALTSSFFEDTIVIRYNKKNLLDTIMSYCCHGFLPLEFKRRKNDRELMVFINKVGVVISLKRVRRNTLIIIHYINDRENRITDGISFDLFNLRRFKKNNKKLFSS